MDYSGRVNSKKGSGGVADIHETNVHTKRRLKELLTSEVLDIDNDPYVFRNHLGLLECKLCITTHVSESSYISHLGGRKHHMNLEKRRILDEKYNNRGRAGFGASNGNVVSINNTPKRTWNKIGRPVYSVAKIRDPDTLREGLRVKAQYPRIAIEEPLFRFMTYYELSSKNQNVLASFLDRESSYSEEDDLGKLQYLVLSAEPYENICFVVPNHREIDRPEDPGQMSETFWWYWDKDTKDFFLQFLYK